MATSRITLGAVLGTVQEAAAATTTTLNSVTQGVGMLNRFIAKHSEEQRVTYALDMEDFRKKLLQEKSMEDAERKKVVREYCKDPENKSAYEESYNRLSAILDAIK